MCCVDAPNCKEAYNHYDELSKLIKTCLPEEILVQGGEILYRKKSIEWLKKIREEYPRMKISFVSNGNDELNMIDIGEEIFDRVTFSLVGFQSETYKKIMGLDISTTLKIAEKLILNKKVKVYIKYLTTPINFYESNLFLQWVLNIMPDQIHFADATMNKYIKGNTTDKYWDKIFERTGKSVREVILSNKKKIIDNNVMIKFDLFCKEKFEINNEFIDNNEFENIFNGYDEKW